MKSKENKNIFENYRPNLGLKFTKNEILESTFDNSYDYSQKIILKEATRNLWGNLVASLIAIGFGTLPFLFDVNYEDKISEIVFKILMPIIGILGLAFFATTINKLLNSNNRSYVIISNEGIKYYKSETNKTVKLKWQEIKKGVLKLYASRYSPDTYLLILTNQDKLVEIYLNELVDPKSRLFDKTEIKGLLGNINPRHNDIRKYLGKYTSG